MANETSNDRRRPERKRRRWPRVAAWTLVALVVLFHAGGGWYFADQLRIDGFSVMPHEPDYRAKVVSLDSEVVTLEQGNPADGDLFNPGVFGLTWNGGYGEVSTIVELSDVRVTRQYVFRRGSGLSPGQAVDVDPWMYPEFQIPGSTVAITSIKYQTPLGQMDAVFVPGNSDLWVIIVHGKNAAPREAARLAGIVADAGYPSLAISHRNDLEQPADPSGYHRFGVTEWEDLEGAVDYAISKGADRIVLAGLSSGAAIVFSFMENSELNDRVSGLIFDAPNIDFGATVDHSAASRRLPLVGLPVPGTLIWVAKTIATVQVGVDWNEINYLDRSDHLLVPTLVLHGTADPSVPIEISRGLAAQRPDLVTLIEFEGAKHVQSWNLDPRRYQDAVREFLSRQ